jgi:phosphoglycolate phosphatase-like HAD superfamily hydrolase
MSDSQPYAHAKAILFDVDGTLADSGQLGFDATLKILEQNDYATITYAEYCEGCRYTTPERLARNAGLTPEQGNEFYEVGKQLGQAFDDLYIDLVSMETAAFFPGMYDLVDRISLPMGVLTNAAERYAHAVLRVNDRGDGRLYPNRFGAILGADTVPKPKPHPDGLLQACRELQVSPADCVFIGDSPSDALAATAAGMPCIGVTWGAHAAERLLPHVAHLCETVEELEALLLPSRTL